MAALAEHSGQQLCTRSLAPQPLVLKEPFVFNLIACHLSFLCLLAWLHAPHTLLLPTSLSVFTLTAGIDVSTALSVPSSAIQPHQQATFHSSN